MSQLGDSQQRLNELQSGEILIVGCHHYRYDLAQNFT